MLVSQGQGFLWKVSGTSEQQLLPHTVLATSTAPFYRSPLANTNRNKDLWSSIQTKPDLRHPLLPQTRGGPQAEEGTATVS